ncbi:spore coat protein [Clostridium sp. P21]|uniref:Spore coat protein n=1 Tax=Clostridium muellerianum TaxID=2716538 RepID=A0A7Y0EK19_9CLOT|nr:spore coat protein [Clostridium muellerianum]NMM64894.1 spore coat protein [Clostridium muellerianum]
MEQQTIAPHETMQLHELLTFKDLCLTKSVTMSLLVSDEELKTILKNDAATLKQHIKELSELMTHSPIATSVDGES